MRLVKEQGGGEQERNEMLTEKPRDFENRRIGVPCLSARTDIWCCHQLSFIDDCSILINWSINI